ncbi:MAG TPA: FMN-binding protein [Bacteroidota bacterium]|nr:FMN-binding protein [Bacteroidota bacterium]
MKSLLCFLCFIAFAASSRGQSTIEDKAKAGLHKMFGDSAAISSSWRRLSGSEIDSIARLSHSRWQRDSLQVYVCSAHQKTVGYGFVDDVKGKVQFITYLTGINTDGKVQDVDILAYRESYGGEVAYESFRRQFRDKSSADKLIPGKDIKNISGATISVRAITTGVRKILLTYDLLKGTL